MSLDSLVNAAAGSDLKFVFVGGKGGVGKTTSSSAIATLLATICQKRVLLVSTDPAHSLGDAWRQKFSNVPTKAIAPAQDGTSTGGSLDIMEVDPQQSMEGELQQWAAVSQELFAGSSSPNDKDKNDEWSSKMAQFQEWLSGIPGIDEATALSNAITHIESGNYDLIVFDTAPTGHTLKLLALPEILEQGIDKLQSWQTTFWSYWEAFKTASSTASMTKAQRRAALKNQVKDKLTQYKHDIQKVAMMLQDQTRTRFVVVCIAEFLSVSETQRLLQELTKNQVIASHIIVNQLVVQDALTQEQLTELESLAEVGNLQLPQELLRKTVHACRLTTARKSIQQRYLSDLKGFTEVTERNVEVCEVPLLPEEVTGTDAIRRFAKLLVRNPDVVSADSSGSTANTGGKLYDHLIAAKNGTATTTKTEFSPGDVVQVTGLAKSPQFNDLEGKVTTHRNDETGRYGVMVQFQGKKKTLALQPKNLVFVRNSDKKHKSGSRGGNSNENAENAVNGASSGMMDKAKKILEDPEIKDLVAQNPRFKVAVQDCLENPMNVMKYLGDPEMSPLISKAMSKMGI
ncbi:ATPase GET3 [Seminavis robusta]|uniref:ATPase GET3 n=1 Tax=Seminavis robusta TaxID=568900 RepID=A0A9N8DHT2_9STRA|nr:ATPase GET3 [Seminavis robusta]|eukprot:Sro92_g048090.1 ATPase GET3 (571) ;mRNA; f:49134-50980